MAGADAKLQRIIKDVSRLSWPARAERLDRLEKEFGKGFADVIRREVEQRLQPRAK